MIKRIIWLMAFVMAPVLPVQAHDQAEKPASTFRPGQSVYIVAFRNDGKPDLTAEVEVKKAFEKQKAFKYADKLETADYVFVLYADYTHPRDYMDRYGAAGEIMTGAVAMALSRESYSQRKGDLEALRAAALWKELFSQGRMVSLVNGRSTLPKNIVNKFHKDVLGKK
jgi:hypothetical protein